MKGVRGPRIPPKRVESPKKGGKYSRKKKHKANYPQDDQPSRDS